MARQILVVDGNHSARVHLDHALALAGYAVTGAPSGEQGLRKAWEGRFDLVIVGPELSDMAPVDLVRRLRAAEPDLPVVMVTAPGASGPPVEAVQLGVADFLSREEAPERIAAVVAGVLRRPGLFADRPAGSVEQLLEQARLLIARRAFGQADAFLRAGQVMEPDHPEVNGLLALLRAVRERAMQARQATG